MTPRSAKISTALLAATALLLVPSAASAQQQQQPEQQAQPQQHGQEQQNGQQVADQCLQRLQQSMMQMRDDQFWLTGWGGWGTGYGMGGVPGGQPATGGMGGTPPATTGTAAAPPATTGTTPAAPAAGAPVTTGDPRGIAQGVHSPREQIRALYYAAQVLAYRGEEEGCDYVAGQLETIYTSYAQQLQEAGVDPRQVTDWRQEQLALAQPIDQVEGMHSFRIDHLTGTDVRNVQDENLGSVHDVILDPGTGSAGFILVARGGFLGMGENYVAVPWDQIHATPGLQTVVLNVTEAELERAPTVDPDRFRDPAQMQDQRGPVEQFWTDQRG